MNYEVDQYHLFHLCALLFAKWLKHSYKLERQIELLCSLLISTCVAVEWRQQEFMK